MKRTLLFFVCTLLCANVLLAQEQLAVLKHNDSTRVFYGTTAFVQAYNAATHGDTITLSDGVFSVGTTIRKNLTIRGNGAAPDTARRSSGTYFIDDFCFYSYDVNLNVEGVYFEHVYYRQSNIFPSGKFTKCIFKKLYDIDNSEFIDCIIESGGIMYSDNSAYSTNPNNFTNCIINKSFFHKRIGNSLIEGGLPCFANCNNCILIGNDSTYTNCYNYTTFNNCIVINTSTDSILNRMTKNSILIGWNSATGSYSTGNISMEISDVFENWDGETISYDPETYRLKSSVSDSILGLDGSEVGIFGGFMPFDLRPSYSVIKRFNVANRTTADGKLSVDIEVISE